MIVFAGPSLAAAAFDAPDEMDMRPPAKQGDVYLASLENPAAIGLIDGYFEGVPAVWHKEILWALSQGIAVLGASSMGALRAAELDVYGMIGVGAVYEGYRDGLYDDDDEVALHHAPPEVGHMPLSSAMVNIRATLAAAEAASVLSAEQAARIVDCAKNLFYGDRTWPTILSGIADETADPLRAWLPGNEVDQKQRDALALIDRLARGEITGASVPKTLPFHFEETRLWHSATAQWRNQARRRPRPDRGEFLLMGDDRWPN